jgi:biopolymer transport protein ExbD
MSTHQAVINVLDAARRAGLSRMTFAAQTTNGAAAGTP